MCCENDKGRLEALKAALQDGRPVKRWKVFFREGQALYPLYHGPGPCKAGRLPVHRRRLIYNKQSPHGIHVCPTEKCAIKLADFHTDFHEDDDGPIVVPVWCQCPIAASETEEVYLTVDITEEAFAAATKGTT